MGLGGKRFHFGPNSLEYPKIPPTLHGAIEGRVIRIKIVEEACRFVENNS